MRDDILITVLPYVSVRKYDGKAVANPAPCSPWDMLP